MPSTFQPDDPQLTAYALGELRGADWAEVEQKLAQDPEARAWVEQIRSAARHMSDELHKERPATLLPEHRASIEVQIASRTRPPFRQLGIFAKKPAPVSWRVPALAACVLVGLAMLGLYFVDQSNSKIVSTLTTATTTSPAPEAPGDSVFVGRDPWELFPRVTLAGTRLPLRIPGRAMEWISDRLNNGAFPPPDAVRIEEMLNAFTYEDPQPQPGEAVAVLVELGPCPWDETAQLARVAVRAAGASPATQPTDVPAPVAHAVTVDVNFSSQTPATPVAIDALLASSATPAPASDIYPGQTVCMLYVVRVPVEMLNASVVEVSVDEAGKPPRKAVPLARKNPSEDFQFSAAVARFGLVLRSSKKSKADFDKVIELAREARGKDAHGERSAFIETVEKAKALAE